MDPQILIDLVNTRMPYGKYEGRYINELPAHYLDWMERDNAFPAGRLGMMLRTMHVVKRDGLDSILFPIINEYRTDQKRV